MERKQLSCVRHGRENGKRSVEVAAMRAKRENVFDVEDRCSHQSLEMKDDVGRTSDVSELRKGAL